MAYLMYTYHKFGDLCTSYGIVREFARYCDRVELHSDNRTDREFRNQQKLYAGMKNVELIREPIDYSDVTFGDHSIAHSRKWLDKVMPWLQDPSLPLPDWFEDYWRFDTQWYGNAGIPFHLKWDNFDYQRDMKSELETFYDKFGIKDNEEYVFVHEDPERGYVMRQELIDDSVRQVRLQDHPEVDVIDVLYTIEKARDVHLFNTGTATLVDQAQIRHDRLFYHRYIRPLEFEQPIRKSNWRVIT